MDDDCDDLDRLRRSGLRRSIPLASCHQRPENDFCEDAIEIVCPEGGGDVTISGTTVEATFDDVGICGTSNTAPGVWYRVSHDGLLTASTCNQANYDTKLSVFDGECGALGCVTGNDDAPGCSGFTSEVIWGSDGSERLILVHGFGTATGDFDLTISCELHCRKRLLRGRDRSAGSGLGHPGIHDNRDASTSRRSIDCGTSVTAPGVWYTVDRHR